MSAPMEMPLEMLIKASIPEWRRIRLQHEIDEEAEKIFAEIKEKINSEGK